MELLTWNIQAGRGVDGVSDIRRIADIIQSMGDPDIVCLQEVACNFPDLDDGLGEDQVNSLKVVFPDHDAFYGAAVDCIGPNNRRMCFGNLILSRLPVVQSMLHQLPRPADPRHMSMPRQVTEVIVRDADCSIRVMTTHLEFFSALQREAHVVRIRQLLDEAHARAKSWLVEPDSGPYEVIKETSSSILCGDFNLEPVDPTYKILVTTDSNGEGVIDAWCAKNGSREHEPTCGIFDRNQWPEGAHCRDFFFLTPDLVPRIEFLEVNASTSASDHQPIRMVLR